MKISMQQLQEPHSAYRGTHILYIASQPPSPKAQHSRYSGGMGKIAKGDGAVSRYNKSLQVGRKVFRRVAEDVETLGKATTIHYRYIPIRG